MKISIETNIKEVTKRIKAYEKKQIPYAVSLALNNTAEIAMKAMKHKIDKDFDVTASWNKVGGKYGLKKKRASKKNLEVEVFIPKANYWMEDHEKGDIRVGEKGVILIPTFYFKNMYPNLKTNKQIKKKAQSLLSNKSKKRIFEGTIRGDKYIMQAGILGDVKQRKNKFYKKKVSGKKKKKIGNRSAVPLFLIKESVKEKPRLDFYETIPKVFEKNINKEFSKAFEFAMRTAK